MNPYRDKAILLLDETMNDQSRLFYSLPEIRRPFRLMFHVLTLPGAWPTAFLPGLDEAWIDFRYKGWRFAVHNHLGEYWFFVSDRPCPGAILEKVASHFARLDQTKRSAAHEQGGSRRASHFRHRTDWFIMVAVRVAT